LVRCVSCPASAGLFLSALSCKKNQKYVARTLTTFAVLTCAACSNAPSEKITHIAPPPLGTGTIVDYCVPTIDVRFPRLSVTPSAYSLERIDELLIDQANYVNGDIRNYTIIISVETVMYESDDQAAQKHIDGERLRYIEQYIKIRLPASSAVKHVYTENGTDYRFVQKEHGRYLAPDNNRIEVSLTF
jgi:hypothetical protein